MHCLPEIQIYLGILQFYLLNLAIVLRSKLRWRRKFAGVGGVVLSIDIVGE